MYWQHCCYVWLCSSCIQRNWLRHQVVDADERTTTVWWSSCLRGSFIQQNISRTLSDSISCCYMHLLLLSLLFLCRTDIIELFWTWG